MHDKQIRRRRITLAVLVIGAVVLLTISFESSSSGPIGAVQRGIGTVFSPIQKGASVALKPVRDLFGWVGDTWSAKSELKDARRDRDRWQQQAIAAQATVRRSKQLENLWSLRDSPLGIESFAPTTARVIVRSNPLWYSQLVIDKGTRQGVDVDMAVVAGDTGNGAGLIGKVSQASAGSAVVSLLTNPSMSVAVKTVDGRSNGDLGPRAGNPRDLVLQHAQLDESFAGGAQIVTAGTISARDDLASVYPPDIPVGRVTKIDDPGSPTELAHVRPFVDLRQLEYVAVLTGSVARREGQ